MMVMYCCVELRCEIAQRPRYWHTVVRGLLLLDRPLQAVFPRTCTGNLTAGCMKSPRAAFFACMGASLHVSKQLQLPATKTVPNKLSTWHVYHCLPVQ